MSSGSTSPLDIYTVCGASDTLRTNEVSYGDSQVISNPRVYVLDIPDHPLPNFIPFKLLKRRTILMYRTNAPVPAGLPP